MSKKQLEVIQGIMAKNAKSIGAKLVPASLGLAKYNKTDSLKQTKENVKLFNFREVLSNSASSTVKKLFDESTLSPELKEKIESLIFENLPVLP